VWFTNHRFWRGTGLLLSSWVGKPANPAVPRNG
jgi:hypothetical protein